jgi:Glyoxalase-like domain
MVQSVQVSIDALVGADVLPFWRAVLGYEYRPDSPDEDLVDPRGRGPSFWFQQMDARGPSATASTSTSGFRTSRPRRGSRPPSPPAAAC